MVDMLATRELRSAWSEIWPVAGSSPHGLRRGGYNAPCRRWTTPLVVHAGTAGSPHRFAAGRRSPHIRIADTGPRAPRSGRDGARDTLAAITRPELARRGEEADARVCQVLGHARHSAGRHYRLYVNQSL